MKGWLVSWYRFGKRCFFIFFGNQLFLLLSSRENAIIKNLYPSHLKNWTHKCMAQSQIACLLLSKLAGKLFTRPVKLFIFLASIALVREMIGLLHHSIRIQIEAESNFFIGKVKGDRKTWKLGGEAFRFYSIPFLRRKVEFNSGFKFNLKPHPKFQCIHFML